MAAGIVLLLLLRPPPPNPLTPPRKRLEGSRGSGVSVIKPHSST
jgi:hypothetical protein